MKKKYYVIGLALMLGFLAMGQGPCTFQGCTFSIPPLNLIFIGTNSESLWWTFTSMKDTIVSTNGESWHGVLNQGDTLQIHSFLQSVPLGGHLQVWVPSPIGGISSPGYYNIEDYPGETALVIKNAYMEWTPATPFELASLPVTWTGLGTSYETFNISVFPENIPKTLNTIRIWGTSTGATQAKNDTTDSIRVVDSGGNVVATIGYAGRVFMVRQGCAGVYTPACSPPTIVGANMQPSNITCINPTSPPLVSAGFQPEIETQGQLSYVAAAFIPTTTTLGIYNGTPIVANTTQWWDPVNFVYHYVFSPSSLLAPNTQYAFVIYLQQPLLVTGAPIEKMTQGFNGSLLSFTYETTLNALTQRTSDNQTSVIASCFQTDPNLYGTPNISQLLPATGYIALAETKIVPRAWMQNTGVFSALVQFPEGYDITTLSQAWANGAPATSIQFFTDTNSALLKFNRSDVTSYFGPGGRVFVVYGKTTDGFAFYGYDTLKKCFKQDTPPVECNDD
ncbi:MAG: hypothetical protein ACP5JP_09760 [bacterium]